MDENLHKDKLESFFQKSLRDQEEGLSPDGWDMPGEEVWAGIDQELDASAVVVGGISWRNVAMAAALLIGILLIGFQAYTNYQLRQELAAQTEQIKTLKEEIQVLKSEKELETYYKPQQGLEEENITTQTAENNLHQPPVEKPTTIAQINLPGAEAQLINPEEESPIAGNATQNDVQALASDAELDKTLQKEEASVSSTNNTAVYFSNTEQVGIAKLHSNPVPLSLPRDKPKAALKAPSLDIDKAPTRLHFFAGVYVAPNLSGNSVMQRRPEAILFRKNESYQWSAERGVKLGVELSSRWRLYSGVSLYNVRLRSQQLFRLEYNPETETRIDDEYESVYALSVPSSYGASDVEVEVRRPANQAIQAGQRLLVDVRTQQELKFVSVPLVVGYQLRNGRVSFGLKAGLALNILNTKTFSSTAQARLAFLRLNRVRVERAYNATQSLTMDYLLGATLAYQLSPNWSIALEPTFRRNITPITETENFRTTNQALGVQLGAYFRL